MNDGIAITIQGTADVIRRLNAYSLQLGDRVTFLALRNGANYLKKQIQNAAPVKTGRLKRSFRVRNSRIHRRSLDNSVGLYIKPNPGKKRDDPKGAYYAHIVDQGYEVKGRSSGSRVINSSSFRSGRKTQRSGKFVEGRHFINSAFESSKSATLQIITQSIETSGAELAHRLGL